MPGAGTLPGTASDHIDTLHLQDQDIEEDECNAAPTWLTADMTIGITIGFAVRVHYLY